MMKLNSFFSKAIYVIALGISFNAFAQYPTIPKNIETIEAKKGRQWILTSTSSKEFIYDSSSDEYTIEDNSIFGTIIHGVKIGNYIYDCDDWGYEQIYIYNASDCKPVTTSQYIPLKYGGPKGFTLDNGTKVYIVPFKAGKFSITGSISKKQLTNSYVMILEDPNWDENYSSRCYTAVVNIKKTSKGYSLKNAYGIYDKNFSGENIVSKDGRLLKNAITEKGVQDMVCEPEWIIEYPGLVERGIPIGFVTK